MRKRRPGAPVHAMTPINPNPLRPPPLPTPPDTPTPPDREGLPPAASPYVQSQASTAGTSSSTPTPPKSPPRLPSPRVTAALAAGMLAIGVAVGAAIGPAPETSLAGERIPLLLPSIAALAGVATHARRARATGPTAAGHAPADAGRCIREHRRRRIERLSDEINDNIKDAVERHRDADSGAERRPRHPPRRPTRATRRPRSHRSRACG